MSALPRRHARPARYPDTVEKHNNDNGNKDMTHAGDKGSGGTLRRDAGIIGLLFACTTSMIGSGWLFGALHASKIAGPLSLWSWIIGAVIVMFIALCFAELAALFPRSGTLVHMSHDRQTPDEAHFSALSSIPMAG